MTKDLGATWTAIDGNLPDVPANAVEAAVVGGVQMVLVGTDRGVFYTCNNGGKWLKLGTTLPNTVITDVRYDSAFKRVVASTMGRGVWSIEEPTAASCDSDAGIGAGGAAGAGGMGGTGPDAGRAGAGGASGGNGGSGVDASGATGGGGSGQGGSNGVGGGSGGAIGAGGGGGATTGPGSTGPGTTTGNPGGTGGSGDDGGCACSMAAHRDGAAMSVGLVGLAFALRRRRRRD
jgi:MYXO-CTERM domain-containing protein